MDLFDDPDRLVIDADAFFSSKFTPTPIFDEFPGSVADGNNLVYDFSDHQYTPLPVPSTLSTPVQNFIDKVDAASTTPMPTRSLDNSVSSSTMPYCDLNEFLQFEKNVDHYKVTAKKPATAKTDDAENARNIENLSSILDDAEKTGGKMRNVDDTEMVDEKNFVAQFPNKPPKREDGECFLDGQPASTLIRIVENFAEFESGGQFFPPKKEENRNDDQPTAKIENRCYDGRIFYDQPDFVVSTPKRKTAEMTSLQQCTFDNDYVAAETSSLARSQRHAPYAYYYPNYYYCAYPSAAPHHPPSYFYQRQHQPYEFSASARNGPVRHSPYYAYPPHYGFGNVPTAPAPYPYQQEQQESFFVAAPPSAPMVGYNFMKLPTVLNVDYFRP